MQGARKFETQLIKFTQKAKSVAKGVIVVYGGKYCYVNLDNPTRLMKHIIEEQAGPGSCANRGHTLYGHSHAGISHHFGPV